MKKFDTYDSYLRLTNRMSENSTPIRNLDQVQILNVYKLKKSHHPTILNGLRNKNSQSYKTLCSPSKIFYHTDTPEITQNVKNKYEASERKRQIEANSQRTINPSLEKINSPQQSRIQQNILYNINQESIYKEPKRQVKQQIIIIIKACTQKSQDFNSKINLFTSQIQVIDGNEEYGKSQTHKKSQSIKTFIDLQSSSLQNDCFQIYTDRAKNNNNYEDSFRHLLTSYQKANQIKSDGKKQYPQSRSIYEQSNIVEQQVLKPYNKVFQQSQNEQYIKQNKKGQGDQFYNQQKSNFKIY